jgi:hypothetical protein
LRIGEKVVTRKYFVLEITEACVTIIVTSCKIGSEQESEEVPDWRGFRDFALSGEFDSSSVRSADACFAESIAETGREPYFQRVVCG